MFAKKLITMDIDEDHIRLVTSKIKNGKIEIISSEDIKIKYNLYENEQNQNLKPIRNSIKEYINLNKIKIKNVACTTQNENIIFRNIEIPYIKKERDILDVVKFQLSQYMPIDLEKYILQYKVQNIIESENTKIMNLNIVLFPRNLSLIYKNLIKDLGLKPFLLDTVSNSINKLYKNKYLNITNEQSFIILEIRHKYICLNIFYKDILKINATLIRDYSTVDKIIDIYKYSDYEIKKIYIYGEEDNIIRKELSINFEVINLEINNLVDKNKINVNKYLNNIGLMLNT